MILQTIFRILCAKFPLLITFCRFTVSYVLSGVLGYLIGSIPVAFLLVRWKSSVDIRRTGSGNVGALNSFQVTRSKWVGALVLILDLLKGVLATGLAQVLFDNQFSIWATAGVSVVAGHNFPVWLKFKGGRGLATRAGVMFMLSWFVILIWGIFWLIGFALTRHVNAGNTIASAAELLGVMVVPAGALKMLVGPSIEVAEFRVFAAAVFVVILIKHVDPMREYFAAAAVREKNH